MVYDGYVKYAEAEIHRSAIMLNFRDSEKKKIKKIIKKKNLKKKCPTGSHFGFSFVKFVMGYPCVRHYTLFYIHGPVIMHFLS